MDIIPDKTQNIETTLPMGDPLEKATKHINSETLRPTLEKTIIPQNRNCTKAADHDTTPY